MTTEKKPRTPKPLNAGAAVDRAQVLRSTRASRRAAWNLAFDREEHDAEQKIRDRVDPAQLQQFDVMLRALGPAEEAPFLDDTDPEDSDRLRELRAAIDNHLGWASPEDEGRGDYLARVKEVGAMLKMAEFPPTDVAAVPGGPLSVSVIGVGVETGVRTFDARGVQEPLSPARLSVAKGPHR